MTDTKTDITEADAEELLAALVAIPSVNPDFRAPGEPDEWFNEARIAAYVADWLRKVGCDVEIEVVQPERPNVIARIKGTSGGLTSLWEGHLDTVQVTGMNDPFTPRIENGRLYGRGAVDDKGCVTAFMLAMRELARNPPPGDVTFLAAMDEEFRAQGIWHHVKRGGEHYDLGVAGEPTNLRIVRACKGCVRWYVEVLGRAGHTAKPHEGVDAITAARRILTAFEEEMTRRTGAHVLLGRSTLTCTAFEAGEGPNTVPSRAMMRFDYRLLPGEDGTTVWHELAEVAKSAGEATPGIRVIVHDPFINTFGMDVPETAPIVGLMGEVCRDVGIDPTPEGVPFGSDATKMVKGGNIPTIVFGPGSIDQAHSLGEYVEIAEVAQAARMLVATARRAGRS